MKKQALIVWGGWNGHEPEQCANIFEPWLTKKGYKVTVSDTLDAYLNKRKMRNYRVILPVWTMGEISDDQWQGLREAVKRGTNIAGWHGGMCDSFRQNVGYQFMTGGQWVAHPGGSNARYTVNVADQKDPITKGLRDFRMHTEQYYMHTDPGNDVLAHTTFHGRYEDISWIKSTVMPVVWKRMYYKSRIFYTSLGHVAKDFKQPEVLEIVKRGIMWAAKDKIVPEYNSPRKKAARKKK